MAPRAYWKGYLKLSLVSCPIALFPATSEREKISFHQLNKNTGHRIKYRKVDAESGDEVESADIIKGYEVGKGEYIELDPEELEAVAIESKRIIDIDEFVPKRRDRRALSEQPLLHRARWRGRSAGIRRDPGSHPQRGHGCNRQGRVHVARAHHCVGSTRQGTARHHAAISLRGAQRGRNISTTFPMRKFPRICSNSPRISWRRRRAISSRASSMIDTRMRSRSCLKRSRKASRLSGRSGREPTNVVNLMEALRRSVEASGKSAADKGKARSSARTQYIRKGRTAKTEKGATGWLRSGKAAFDNAQHWPLPRRWCGVVG